MGTEEVRLVAHLDCRQVLELLDGSEDVVDLGAAGGGFAFVVEIEGGDGGGGSNGEGIDGVDCDNAGGVVVDGEVGVGGGEGGCEECKLEEEEGNEDRHFRRC